MFLIICPSTALRFVVVITSSNIEFLWILPKHYRLQQELTRFIFDKLIAHREEYVNLSEHKLKSVISHIMNAVMISEMETLQYNQREYDLNNSSSGTSIWDKLDKLKSKHLGCLYRDFSNLKVRGTHKCCDHLKSFGKEHISICKSHYDEWISSSMMLPGKLHWLFWNDTIAIIFLIIVTIMRWIYIYNEYSFIHLVDFLNLHILLHKIQNIKL